MSGGDKLYTIEINFGSGTPLKTETIAPPAVNIPAVNINTDTKSSVSFPESSKTGQPEFSADRTKAAQDAKRQEFLRLRDTIFNKNKGPVNNTFLEQARKYADKEAEPSPPVSFLCYWPTYDVMSESQLKWYFCWREFVRNGTYPHTTLSYIFVYIYELINEVGITDAEDGLIKLCSLWSAYRKLYTALDRYMGGWIADYIAIHFPQGLPEGTLERVVDKEIKKKLPENVIIESLFNGGERSSAAEEILVYIFKYSAYNPEKSKFYQTGDKEFIRSYLAGAFHRLNDYMKKKTGKGIFASFTPEKPKRRMPYQNAIYQGGVRSVDCGQYDYAENKKLKDFIANVVKAAENALRKLVGYKGKLKTELTPEYVGLIDKYIAERRKNEIIERRSKIDIDKSKVRQIIDGSDIIRERLLSGIDNGDTESVADAVMPLSQQTEEIPAMIASDDDYTDPYDRLLETLTDIQRSILLYIGENGGAAGLAELSVRFGGVFVQTEIDGINESSIEYLGDILILTEGDLLAIQEI